MRLDFDPDDARNRERTLRVIREQNTEEGQGPEEQE